MLEECQECLGLWPLEAMRFRPSESQVFGMGRMLPLLDVGLQAARRAGSTPGPERPAQFLQQA